MLRIIIQNYTCGFGGGWEGVDGLELAVITVLDRRRVADDGYGVLGCKG
jgi:hypothetical protein